MFKRLTEPSEEPLSLDALKAFLRVSHSSDDDLILRMARTARAYLEKRFDLALLDQQWHGKFVPQGRFTAHLRPTSVSSVSNVDIIYTDGSTVPLDAASWSVTPGAPNRVDVVAATASAGQAVAAIGITFQAGWPSAEQLPEDLRHAVGLLTGHYYEARDLFEQSRYVALPYAVEALVSPYREVTL